MFGFDARLFLRGHALDQAQGDLLEKGHILRASAFENPTVVICERGVQRPVQLVFDGPVPSDPSMKKFALACFETAEIVTDLDFGFLFELTLSKDATDALETNPFGLALKRFDIGNKPIRPPLFAPVGVVFRFKELHGDLFEILLHRGLEEDLDLLVRVGLVGFEAQNIVRFGFDELVCDVRLAPDRIDGDGAAFEADQLEQFGDRSDFILAVTGIHLAQDELVVDGPSADEMKRRLLVTVDEGAPQRLSIDGDQLLIHDFLEVLDPALEALYEGFGVEHGEDPVEGVVRRDAVFELEKLLKPVDARCRELLDFGPSIQAADGRTQSDCQDVVQIVAPPDEGTRIRQIGKVS